MVKSLFEMRWECRVRGIKAIHCQIDDALVEVFETSSVMKNGTETGKRNAKLTTLYIWNDILTQLMNAGRMVDQLA